MNFISLQPFVPSGSNFEEAKQFFQELGFELTWSEADYAGFKNNNCQFILQRYVNKDFAENFMVSVAVHDVEAFRTAVIKKKLPEKFGIRIGEVVDQPYGREVNIIDMAGVCWHFVQ
jgi:hypothetical protein